MTTNDIPDQEDIRIHWQHPRYGLERPILLIWVDGFRENWVAEIIESNTALVIAKETIIDTTDTCESTDSKKISKRIWATDDPIPEYIETAILNYTGNYGPIDDVLNTVQRNMTDIEHDNTTINSYTHTGGSHE